MKSVCSFAIAGLPDMPWDFLRQNSRNFLSLRRITVSGLTRISSGVQSLQILERNDQNSRSLFLSTGLFRLAPVHGELLSEHEDPQRCNPIELREDDRIERLYDRHHERIFMPEGWSPETPKFSEISWDGVFAEHGLQIHTAC
jgi:hypothetical protein